MNCELFDAYEAIRPEQLHQSGYPNHNKLIHAQLDWADHNGLSGHRVVRGEWDSRIGHNAGWHQNAPAG